MEYYAQFWVLSFEKDLAQLEKLPKTVIVGVEDVIYEERLQKLGWLSKERRKSEETITVFEQFKGGRKLFPSCSVDRTRNNRL